MSDARTPALRDVFVEQFRMIGLSMLPEFGMLAVLLAVVSLVSDPLHGNAINLRPENFLFLVAVSVLLPFAIWKGRDRLEDGSYFTMPVEHRRHALVRVAAGWLWLLVLVAIVMAWISSMIVLSGGSFVNPGSTYLLLESAETMELARREDLREFAWVTPAWTWLLMLTGPTVAYLLSSALNLATRRPVRVVLGTVVGLMLLGIATNELVFDLVRFGLDPVIAHPWGLDTAFTGGSESLKTLVVVAEAGGPVETQVWTAIPTTGAYARATLLWLAIGAVALWAATRLLRERAR